MVLYKYLPPARLDVLEGRMIRLTQPAAFNDPFEFKPSIESTASQDRKYVEDNFAEIVKAALVEYLILSRLLSDEHLVDLLRRLLPGVWPLLDPQLLPGVLRAVNLMLNANVGVLCLSEIRDSLLMWGHYTDNHQGFVIGFDQNHPFFSLRRRPEDELGFLRKVKYCCSRSGVT